MFISCELLDVISKLEEVLYEFEETGTVDRNEWLWSKECDEVKEEFEFLSVLLESVSRDGWVPFVKNGWLW